jgi:LemA protein
MASNRTSHIIEKVYSRDQFNRVPTFGEKVRNFFAHLGNMLPDNFDDNDRLLIRKASLVSLLSLGITFLVGIYYYNTFYIGLQNMRAANSKVHTYMQQRRNVQVNISKIALDYSEHEAQIFKGVVASRQVFGGADMKKLLKQIKGANSKGVAVPPKTMDSFMSKLFALSEQYPNLKLSSNFLKSMDAVLELERNIATSRVSFIDLLNRYSTMLVTFPGNFYNFFFSFEAQPYYKADQDARKFKIIDY